MTNEEKELLIRDLCARLPYGVIASVRGSDEEFQYFHIVGVKDGKVWVKNDMLCVDAFDDVEVVKPYLRPISSMTEEEQKEFVGFHCVNLCSIIIDEMLTLKDEIKMFDWLNEHHFDYRGLIPMGLALEAPEGMYNTKTE